MNVMTVNTGSSSVRLAYFERAGSGQLKELANSHHTFTGHEPETLLREFAQAHEFEGVSLVAHRIVHGGARFTTPIFLDVSSEQEIEHLSPLAPLHNPVALRWIRAARKVWGSNVPQVGVFDTAFYGDLPKVARTYAIPHSLDEKHGLRRYGFHGLAHQAMWRRWSELRPKNAGSGRLISFQLGAGCSITATENGKPRDTSMGFSPMEGLMMATRSGDVDPGLITFLQRQEGLTTQEIDRLLNEASGLLGVSGISADMRQLLESQDERARLAVSLYSYRARKYLGAYLAVLGGADAIIFGGGVGEHAPSIRARILEGMEWLGILLDPESNLAAVGLESRISAPNSQIEVWVMPVDEAAILAREALTVATNSI